MNTQLLQPGRKAFTLIEMVMVGALAAITGGGAYVLLNSGMILYAKNFSINSSHYTARSSLERMMLEINNAGSAPILVNDKCADVAGNGPAAGIRLCTPASAGTYTITSAVAATGTSATLQVAAGKARPRDSDILLINAGPVVVSGSPVQVEIASVSGSGSSVVATLKGPVGSAIPANSSCLILQQVCFVAVGRQMRFYPKAMSEARQGATVYNTPANWVLLSTVEPLPGATQTLPFSYADSSRRPLQVNLRTRADNYAKSKRVTPFTTFFNLKSAIATKSTYLDASKLTPIQ